MLAIIEKKVCILKGQAVQWKRHLTSFRLIILGFAGVIVLGALLLSLPIASADGRWTPFRESLFTATSAVCVTGLVVHDTASYWSLFGQGLILLMIQIGGLGVVTAAAMFMMFAGKHISIRGRSAMQDALSAPAVGGIVRLTIFILKGTFIIELLGGHAARFYARLRAERDMDGLIPLRLRVLQRRI